MRQRKPIKCAGHFILDENGNKVAIDPQKVPSIANACAAAVKTMETGQQWKVKGA